MKIILLGYMASGKSAIGRALAKEINIPFIDLDNYIENKENNTLQFIFKNKGEIYFRKIENHYLKEIINTNSKFVLSLGGGTPCYGDAMSFIKKSKTTSFFLNAKIGTLADRLLNEKEKRPLIANIDNEKLNEFVAKHLFERISFYKKAMFAINIDHKSILEITTELKDILKTASN